MKGLLASDILSSEQLKRAQSVADALCAEKSLDEALSPYRDFQYDPGSGDTPQLHLEDVSGIPFVSGIPGIEEYQHRARVRAGDGDLFAAVTKPSDGYEPYCQNKLGLGAPDFVQAKPVKGLMEIADACTHGENLDQIAQWSREHGNELVAHPYMAIEPVWEIARKLDARGIHASVLGPPPPVLWIANDKGTLANIVEQVADGAWNVETHQERTPQAMVKRLVEMAERHQRVGLKRTRCASAMGNIVYESAMIRRDGPAELDRNVRHFLSTTEWEKDEIVLAVEWAENEESPSTQMWIPPVATNAGQAERDQTSEVRLDGVYQQILSGPERVFVGSRPSTLPEPVNRSLIEASFVMASVFQQLGYVGRCSFDFIVGGDVSSESDDDFDIRMTECNGRWGGTSTPMHLVDRLFPGSRPHYVAQDFVHPELAGATLPEVLDAVGDELYDPHTGQGRFVLYNPGPLAEKGKIDVISVGEHPDDAERGVQQVLPGLLGLS
jgi:hypothetical protein